MEKAAIYCRLSEEDHSKKHKTEDSGSIRNQKAMLLEYSIRQGWEVYDIYSDDNYTGSDRNRPEFTRLLNDAKAHRFDIIVEIILHHRISNTVKLVFIISLC